MFVAINVNLQIIHQIVKFVVYLSIISGFDSILKDFRRLFFIELRFEILTKDLLERRTSFSIRKVNES